MPRRKKKFQDPQESPSSGALSSISLQPRYLTIPEAAAYLRTSVWDVRTLIRSGAVPHIPRGKRFILDRIDLDRLQDESKKVAA
jgi:excisionase family DNA binding protein